MYAAIDVGGTKTLIAVFLEDGTLKEQIKFPTPKDYDGFKSELAINVAKLSTDDFKAAAVAIPGKVDRKHGVGIAFGNLPWKNVPIQADAEHILNSPVVVENDANLAALSEARLIKKYKKTLYVTISTGIGSGLIIDGNIAPSFADAEVGHILLEHRGKLQRWQEFASGRAIVAKFGKKASDITPDDADAWYIIARNIAIGLIDLIATLTPDVIVLGGGVGSHYEKFIGRLDEQLKIYDNPLVTIPPILKAQRAEEAVIYGCYELAKDNFGHDH
jgi:predicted NBD/HSP70 family sugar kinase